jgi:hypothetical protein
VLDGDGCGGDGADVRWMWLRRDCRAKVGMDELVVMDVATLGIFAVRVMFRGRRSLV